MELNGIIFDTLNGGMAVWYVHLFGFVVVIAIGVFVRLIWDMFSIGSQRKKKDNVDKIISSLKTKNG